MAEKHAERAVPAGTIFRKESFEGGAAADNSAKRKDLLRQQQKMMPPKAAKKARGACCPGRDTAAKRQKDLILSMRSRNCGELNRGSQNLEKFQKDLILLVGSYCLGGQI